MTVETLLAEMTSLKSMAEFPSPAYTTKQFSSYDRASVKRGEDGWFANHDGGFHLRTEEHDGRTEYVMMDAKGPGAVVRIWSANPTGILRIYLDGSDKPTLEADMGDVLGGQFPGLPDPIAGVRGRGYNLYFPIPYAQSCKITRDQNGPHDDGFHHIDYRTYEPGTKVVSFDLQQLDQLQDEIKDIARKLTSPRDLGVQPEELSKWSGTLAPGASQALLDDKNKNRAITQFAVTVDPSLSEQALRSVVLSITFDGEETVEAPLGDFFGSAPGINPYESLPMGVTRDGELWSHWIMPYKTSATVRITNMGDAPLDLTSIVGTSGHDWSDRSMYFHAGYRAAYDLRTRPRIDWNYLTAEGKGVFAGAAFTIDNPTKVWWGEGDEKVYIDGETFPSWFGTGTEDYYGYAWAAEELFNHAYHNQTRMDGPANYGRTSLNRFHILDRIPFNQSIDFNVEVWHHYDVVINQAVTTYWYGRPGAHDDYKPLEPTDLVVRPMPAYEPPKVSGAIEGENMNIISQDGEADPQNWNGLSGERHLFWHTVPKLGSVLKLNFDVPKAGTYRVLGRFVRAPDYGVAELSINGQPVGQSFDFYNEQVTPTEEIDLGRHDLLAGANEMDIKITGTNPNAAKAYRFAIDYLRLEPVSKTTP